MHKRPFHENVTSFNKICHSLLKISVISQPANIVAKSPTCFLEMSVAKDEAPKIPLTIIVNAVTVSDRHLGSSFHMFLYMFIYYTSLESSTAEWVLCPRTCMLKKKSLNK